MISDVVTLSSLVQQAPALVVAVLALMFAGWTYRQSRRAVAQAEARTSVSAVRQGRRLGTAEKRIELLDMRRRITEWELEDVGIRLSIWPPDGIRRRDEDKDDDPAGPADVDPDPRTSAYETPPVPPLPDMARHRRSHA
jgi:hypothetical protein